MLVRRMVPTTDARSDKKEQPLTFKGPAGQETVCDQVMLATVERQLLVKVRFRFSVSA
jgi:hypothetical protein